MSYKTLLNKAQNLVDKLQNNITTSKIQIYENYGQKEIRKFEDKYLLSNNLTYSEKCEIKNILFKVSSIC